MKMVQLERYVFVHYAMVSGKCYLNKLSTNSCHDLPQETSVLKF